MPISIALSLREGVDTTLATPHVVSVALAATALSKSTAGAVGVAAASVASDLAFAASFYLIRGDGDRIVGPHPEAVGDESEESSNLHFGFWILELQVVSVNKTYSLLVGKLRVSYVGEVLCVNRRCVYV